MRSIATPVHASTLGRLADRSLAPGPSISLVGLAFIIYHSTLDFEATVQ
ncbi:hypothetical protein GMORB2_5493 [Geosmithia morbida]|uniref:Uncharacterized protein n=1 Tax=Geosmithia morbida TaxID=1094350 RepID=A0A9P4YWE7_9HYPO|nr:uncharacterized protein GMORB2_5493 [Geosmithia morbida]KAF4123777.1 hypothetical protein GMORB2_5493 [Geosmithia morbida]